WPRFPVIARSAKRDAAISAASDVQVKRDCFASLAMTATGMDEVPVPQRKIHYGWIVVGVTFMTLLIGAGVRSTPGILMVPFESEFHWSRATISFAVALGLFLYGFIGPFAAAVMERFGLRRTMLTSLSLLAVGVAATTLMRESWQLILLWGLVV